LRIKIEKIISENRMSSVLNDVADSVNARATVRDVKGKVVKIFGNSNHTGNDKHPITVQDEICGWVTGNQNICCIASLISQFVHMEFEKKMLAAETLEKYKELAQFYDSSEKITTCLDSKEVADLIIDEAKKIIDFDTIFVMLLNEETGRLETLSSFGNEYTLEIINGYGHGLTGHVLKTGRPEIVNHINTDPRFKTCYDQVNSMMCAPLKIKSRIIGVISLSSERPVNYTSKELKLFIALTFQAAVAIENAKLYEKLNETFLTTIYTLAETIEKRDPYTGGHTKRVTKYSLVLGKAFNFSKAEIKRLQLAAILHDIGKIGIRDNILLKEDSLNETEFEEIRKHTIYGEEILNHIEALKNIIPGVKFHHEHYDGKGYPSGLKGKNIDVIARIIAVADTFDAIVTDRPYRKGIDVDTALEELQNNSGTQFDPVIVEAFTDAFNRGFIV